MYVAYEVLNDSSMVTGQFAYPIQVSPPGIGMDMLRFTVALMEAV